MASKETSGSIKPSKVPIYLGANPQPSGNHGSLSKVDIYQVAIYNRVLSEEEISSLFQEEIHSVGLLKYVDFTGQNSGNIQSGVKVEIDAKDNTENTLSYSFDGGKSWSQEKVYWHQSNQKSQVFVKDEAGNISEQEIQISKIDSSAPSVSYAISTSTNGSNSWYKALTLKGTITDNESGAGSVVYCVTTGSTCTPNKISTITENAFEVSLGSNAKGQRICSRVTDKVGNTSEVKCSGTYQVDTTNPSASWSINSSTSGSNSWYKALSVKATLSDSHSGVSSAKYCTTTGSTCTPGTNATISSNSFTVTLGSNASAQKVCTQVTDKSGRISSVTCSSAYKVDTTNPTAKISATVSNNTIKVSASGSSDSHSGIANYQYSKDNKTWYTSTSNSYTFTGLADGTYTVYVKVTDKSGRVGSVVSTKATVTTVKYLVSSSVHSGWTLTGWKWEYFDSYWQIRGESVTDGKNYTAITTSKYDLTNYKTLKINNWTSYNSGCSTSLKIYLCTSSSDCTLLSTTTYSYSNGDREKGHVINQDISGYTGQYYIKMIANHSASTFAQINIREISLNP